MLPKALAYPPNLEKDWLKGCIAILSLPPPLPFFLSVYSHSFQTYLVWNECTFTISLPQLFSIPLSVPYPQLIEGGERKRRKRVLLPHNS